jgi:hypothetical protein
LVSTINCLWLTGGLSCIKKRAGRKGLTLATEKSPRQKNRCRGYSGPACSGRGVVREAWFLWAKGFGRAEPYPNFGRAEALPYQFGRRTRTNIPEFEANPLEKPQTLNRRKFALPAFALRRALLGKMASR